MESEESNRGVAVIQHLLNFVQDESRTRQRALEVLVREFPVKDKWVPENALVPKCAVLPRTMHKSWALMQPMATATADKGWFPRMIMVGDRTMYCDQTFNLLWFIVKEGHSERLDSSKISEEDLTSREEALISGLVESPKFFPLKELVAAHRVVSGEDTIRGYENHIRMNAVLTMIEYFPLMGRWMQQDWVMPDTGNREVMKNTWGMLRAMTQSEANQGMTYRKRKIVVTPLNSGVWFVILDADDVTIPKFESRVLPNAEKLTIQNFVNGPLFANYVGFLSATRPETPGTQTTQPATAPPEGVAAQQESHEQNNREPLLKYVQDVLMVIAGANGLQRPWRICHLPFEQVIRFERVVTGDMKPIETVDMELCVKTKTIRFIKVANKPVELEWCPKNLPVQAVLNIVNKIDKWIVCTGYKIQAEMIPMIADQCMMTFNDVFKRKLISKTSEQKGVQPCGVKLTSRDGKQIVSYTIELCDGEFFIRSGHCRLYKEGLREAKDNICRWCKETSRSLQRSPLQRFKEADIKSLQAIDSHKRVPLCYADAVIRRLKYEASKLADQKETCERKLQAMEQVLDEEQREEFKNYINTKRGAEEEVPRARKKERTFSEVAKALVEKDVVKPEAVALFEDQINYLKLVEQWEAKELKRKGNLTNYNVPIASTDRTTSATPPLSQSNHPPAQVPAEPNSEHQPKKNKNPEIFKRLRWSKSTIDFLGERYAHSKGAGLKPFNQLFTLPSTRTIQLSAKKFLQPETLAQPPPTQSPKGTASAGPLPTEAST